MLNDPTFHPQIIYTPAPTHTTTAAASSSEPNRDWASCGSLKVGSQWVDVKDEEPDAGMPTVKEEESEADWD